MTEAGERVLAVIPARGGSKGLPGKNVRPLCGLPLIGHSLRLAALCPSISRTVVTTDSALIAEVAREHGGWVPFLRSGDLARDETAMWPVLQDALARAEGLTGEVFTMVLLLDPTSPGRLPEDVEGAIARLTSTPGLDGVVGVSEPHFNPIWHCVIERDGRLEPLVSAGTRFARRQDVPRVYRINASLYVWRTAFMRSVRTSWMEEGRIGAQVIPEERAIHIDTVGEFEDAERMVRSGRVRLPWVKLEGSEGAG